MLRDADDTNEIRVKVKFEPAPEPFRRPDFPVAAPPTPAPRRVRKVAPDIFVIPSECPEYLLSPPPPQEDGFLFVPQHTFRAPRGRRQERRPLSPRPLPSPPGPPACPLPEIECCPWANSPATPSQASPTSTSTVTDTVSTASDSDSDSDSDAEDRFFVDVAPFLFLVDGGSDDEGEYEPLDLDWLKFKDTASCSGDKAPGAKNDAEAEEMRDVAADEEFLGELGLDRQGFMSLLGGTGM